MKHAKVPNNLDMRHHKGWNPGEAPWHVASFGTDKVKSGKHALPRPPKQLGGIQGTTVTMLLLCAWTAYLLCKIMMEIIKTSRLLKPNEAGNEMESATPQTQRPIPHTDKERLQELIPKNNQRTIATEATGTMTTPSTDTKLGIERNTSNCPAQKKNQST